MIVWEHGENSRFRYEKNPERFIVVVAVIVKTLPEQSSQLWIGVCARRPSNYYYYYLVRAVLRHLHLNLSAYCYPIFCLLHQLCVFDTFTFSPFHVSGTNWAARCLILVLLSHSGLLLVFLRARHSHITACVLFVLVAGSTSGVFYNTYRTEVLVQAIS